MNGPSHITISLGRRRHMLVAYFGLLPVVLICCGLTVVYWIKLPPKIQNVRLIEIPLLLLATAIPGLLTICIFLLAAMLISALMQDLFSRTLTIDLDARSIDLKNVPGLNSRYSFAEVSSIKILYCDHRGNATIWLCMCITGRTTSVRLYESMCRSSSANELIEASFVPLADHIAGLIGVPVSTERIAPLRALWIWGRQQLTKFKQPLRHNWRAF